MPNKLKVTNAGDREVVITRDFDAPRHLVFDAWTKPEFCKRWLNGPDGWELAVCDIDLRPGGKLRYEWRQPDGTRMGMSGVYREVIRPDRIVHTEIFDEDWTGGETLVTLVLTERGGKTTTTMTILYSSTQARDAALKTGMTDGMAMGYDRLDQILAKKE
jgi:uncharacterized protein YndB with AHSA1/START domain